MMTLGGGRVIITYGRLTEIVVAERGPWQAVVITCTDLLTSVNDPDKRIRIAYVGRPDALWKLSGCYVCECRVPLLEVVRIKKRASVYSLGKYGDEGRVKGFGMGMLVMWGLSESFCHLGKRPHLAHGDAHAKKSVDKLSAKEFHELFCIPNGVSVELTDEEAVSTENNEDHVIFFSKEQFNAGLRFPLPSLFKEFLHFTQIPPAYIHPNMVRKLKTDIFSFVACLPSMQLVTNLPDSTKGAAKRHVLVKGVWAGLAVHPDRPFAPNQSSLKANKRGKLVEWVEKASFDRLNMLFEITAAERVVNAAFYAEPPFGHAGASAVHAEHTPKADA
ncbi:hypothetical protein CK203_096345 [Vitis vinifera]|uniref:Uncharacterized protein n=1 Tax=Vitis vinifera TaxID=29760 RepID=A0A438F4L8_VITVI|nr:hypothetical protein CK203_096345 [Vitis vinifera]